MKRRQLLKYSALCGGAGLIALGGHLPVVRPSLAIPPNKRLVVIFLRGGADGLNIVVPHGTAEYYAARPSISILPPGEPDGVLDLDGYFGLHPALSALLPQWQKGNLAFVHNSGSPDSTRSHFDAQDYIELGTPGTKATQDGWMNRLVGILKPTLETQAVSVGVSTALTLSGPEPVTNTPLGPWGQQEMAVDRPNVYEAFDQLYGGETLLSQVYQTGRQARELLMAELNQEMVDSSRSAPLPHIFIRQARQLAQLMQGDTRTQLAFLSLGGWDTHVNQGGSQGQFANRLQHLGDGLAQLVDSLGDLYRETTIVVMSEFGRTIAENGSGGTDHGRGNVMWVLGEAVRGGQVYGEWSGLSESDLHDERDLPVTTDYREVLTVLLANQWGLSTSQMKRVFPGYQPRQSIPLL